MQTFKMWENTPAVAGEEPILEYYPCENKKTDSAIVICPGGGYAHRADHEGKGYAEFFNSIGMDAFVLQYRVSPYRFPVELADSRRSIRWVRANSEKFGINPDKIGIMGSSAGGHLAAMTSTYRGEIDYENEDEIDKTDYLPNFQVLAYPVITTADLSNVHIGSVINLLGDKQLELAQKVDPTLVADEKTPIAFIWHTSDDGAVNVCNSLRYGEKLREQNIKFEMHIFPEGYHGLGLAPNHPHVAQWSGLLKNWLEFNNLL